MRGAWIEMSVYAYFFAPKVSHPVRGAWIEIKVIRRWYVAEGVAPREGCVD